MRDLLYKKPRMIKINRKLSKKSFENPTFAWRLKMRI